MKSGARLGLAIALGLVLLIGSVTGAAAFAWHRAGTVRIAVHDSGPGGNDISMSLPGLFVNAAIALCPLPSDPQLIARLHDASPALSAVASRLATLPDAVLVDVEDSHGTVRVEKTGLELRIRVASPERRLELELPLESVRTFIRRLETPPLGS